MNKALGPPPPKTARAAGAAIPSTRQLVDGMPLIFAGTPYALRDGEIAWLRAGQPAAERDRCDRAAYDEAERKVNTLLHAEGMIDLCNVVEARTVVRGSSAVDGRVARGDAADFHEDVADTRREDGVVKQFDDDRTFELRLRNGLIVRLEAYDAETQREWIQRLNRMIDYWRLRKKADMELFKTVRRRNLDLLRIDEPMESYLGQFGQKWEVSRAVASAELYNMCGVSICRAITVSLVERPFPCASDGGARSRACSIASHDGMRRSSGSTCCSVMGSCCCSRTRCAGGPGCRCRTATTSDIARSSSETAMSTRVW